MFDLPRKEGDHLGAGDIVSTGQGSAIGGGKAHQNSAITGWIKRHGEDCLQRCFGDHGISHGELAQIGIHTDGTKECGSSTFAMLLEIRPKVSDIAISSLLKNADPLQL